MTELPLVNREIAKLLHAVGYPFRIAEHSSGQVQGVFESMHYQSVWYRKIEATEELPDNIQIPTVALAIRFLREEKGFYVTINCEIYRHTVWYYTISLKDIGRCQDKIIMFDTYDLAESAGLTKALRLLIETQTNV